MKKLQVKIMTLVLIAILIILMIPVNAFAAEANMQVVKSESGDYIIYVEGLADTEFKFAISTVKDAEDSALNYINCVEDEEGNKVALITEESISTGANYIYIKNGTEKTMNEIDFSNDEQVFDIKKMQKVENTTKRIKTELLTNLEERNEVIDGIKYTETVGGLKISEEDEDAKYYYKSEKLPAEKYSKLQELAEELNGEAYTEKSMYEKIQFVKEFNKLYEELIKDIEVANQWIEVENKVIKQPIEAQKGDQYVVLLKKVSGNEIVDDAKFLVSYREDEEEKIPGTTETRVVQETAKLPITGDSMILFIISAIIVLALVIVFVRIKKLQKQEGRK